MGEAIVMGRDDFHVVPVMSNHFGTPWPRFGFPSSLPVPTLVIVVVFVFFLTFTSWAEHATNAIESISSTNASDVVIETNSEAGWSFSASVYGYIVPDSREYVQPTITADHGLLHLEARYNYENLDTGSLWVGCNFGGGDAVTWELTPMLGGVIGDTTGIAPGYKGSIGWWKLELYSEGEYVFDTRHSHDSFFYNWSELSLSPLDWFRIGMVTQRTRLYETDRDVQRGVLAGLMFSHVDFTGYILNPDESKPTFVIATSVHF